MNASCVEITDLYTLINGDIQLLSRIFHGIISLVSIRNVIERNR